MILRGKWRCAKTFSKAGNSLRECKSGGFGGSTILSFCLAPATQQQWVLEKYWKLYYEPRVQRIDLDSCSVVQKSCVLFSYFFTSLVAIPVFKIAANIWRQQEQQERNKRCGRTTLKLCDSGRDVATQRKQRRSTVWFNFIIYMRCTYLIQTANISYDIIKWYRIIKYILVEMLPREGNTTSGHVCNHGVVQLYHNRVVYNLSYAWCAPSWSRLQIYLSASVLFTSKTAVSGCVLEARVVPMGWFSACGNLSTRFFFKHCQKHCGQYFL